jgi:hypothetical protein
VTKIKLDLQHHSGLSTGGYSSMTVDVYVDGELVGYTRAEFHPMLKRGKHSGWEVRDKLYPWAGGSVFGRLLPACRHVIRSSRSNA